MHAPATDRPVRAAIVGTGGIANIHVAGLRRSADRAEIVAAVDLDAEALEAFTKKHEIPAAYTGLAEMLEKERPDLVHLCTPPATHVPLAITCLEGGAWVLCEKPLAGSLAELDRVADVEEKTGGCFCGVFQWRFGSSARHLKALAEAGTLGRPLVGLCQTTWYRPPAYFEVPWRGKWETELGGPTLGHGIHAMDLFLHVLGDWEEVQASVATLDRDIEVEDVSMAIVRFAGGAMGSIVNSVLSPREESYLRWDYQKATVELRHLYEHRNRHWTCTPAKGEADVRPAWDALTEDRPSHHGTEIADLLDCMARGQRPLVSGHEIRRTVEFLSALYRAAASGSPVKRGEIQPGDPFYDHVAGTWALSA